MKREDKDERLRGLILRGEEEAKEVKEKTSKGEEEEEEEEED